MDYEKDLNKNQYEAVSTSVQHVRVVAGAGSGKTRVLTYRISYLLEELGCSPWTILAFTFTNKVANEMKERVIKMVPHADKDLTIKTFHSFSAMFLRREISNINFPTTFTIMDEEDQTKLIKDIVSTMGFKRSDKIVDRTISYIEYNKLNERYPEDIKIIKPSFEDERTCLEIYQRYEEEKNKSFSLDFDDLILKTNFILENFPLVRERWRNRIEHILIDEFQDTNDVEYKLIRLLKSPSCSLYVVGDPDQTIYTWRGANQDIILNLQKDFPNIMTYVLDRNYRSTQNILDSANKLIDNNKLRIKKNLYTTSNSGSPICVKSMMSSKGEADYVAREVEYLVKSKKYRYSDIAILYRSNYVTIDFESSFTAKGIPYKLVGGQKFYQRKEIKDVLAYFHLLVNTKDDLSLERIFNVPRRGIGDQNWLIIKTEAKTNKLSIFDYINLCDGKDTSIPPKIFNSLKSMIVLLNETRDKLNKNEEVFSKTLEDMICSLGYYDYLQKDDDADERIENVKSLFSDIRHYLNTYPDSSFDEYLQNIALLSAQDEFIDGDFVSFMTVHTAKGLEFPIVFIIRLNEGVFPSTKSLVEGGFKALEEERRLAYVAFTRAKELLYLTLANDYSYVISSNLLPSRFLKESGNEVLNNAHSFDFNKRNSFTTYEGSNKYQSSINDNVLKNNDSTNTVTWKVGDIVLHKIFGKGVVIDLEGDNIIKVRFDDHGIKSLMGNHPAISKGGNEA